MTIPEERKQVFIDNAHWKGINFAQIREILESCGFEILEDIDLSPSYAEGVWKRSNDYYLPWAEEGNLDAVATKFTNTFALS